MRAARHDVATASLAGIRGWAVDPPRNNVPASLPLLLLTLASALSAPADATAAPFADSMLQRGRYRMAAQEYRRALEDDPDDPELLLGEARAWAGLGWCGQALPVFEKLRDSAAFDDSAALAAGACLSDDARHVDAVAMFEEAVVLSGGGTGAWVELAWAAFVADDQPLFDAITDAQVADDPLHRGTLLLLAARAWRDGDLLAMDWYLEDLRDQQPRAPKADLLTGWAALELGDNDAAIQALRGPNRFARMRLPEISTWLAEANRRAARFREAQRIVEQDLRERVVPPTRQALRLRLQADLEGPAAARQAADALLDAHPFEPELIATAWYVAERAGDTVRAQALRERYDSAVPSGRRPLDRLLPTSTEIP